MIPVATKSVVIFGASDSGRRALELLKTDVSSEVLAFADNAPGRQGVDFHGRPVVAPADLLRLCPDRVVVASHAWRQIVPQLRELGLRDPQIEIFRLVDETFSPVNVAASTLPRLLLLTDDCISLGHGTGALLMRQFADYPSDLLLHAYLSQRGDAALPHSYHVSPSDASGALSASRLSAAQLVAQLRARHGQIDLVYSHFFGEDGLAFLKDLMAALGPSVPVVHHALDFLVRDEVRFDALLGDIAPRLTRIWAIGPSLGERLARVAGRMVTVVNPFSARIPSSWKTEHRPFDEHFSAIVVGNVYTPAVFVKLKEVWSEIRRRYGVGPIKWFAHPITLQRLEQAGVDVSSDIQYCGFAVNEFLHDLLRAADIAIMPFNVADDPGPEDPIGRYSVPSRMTEYMGAGIPVFAAAGRSTDAYRFMAGNNVAVCSSLSDQARFTTDLVGFMRDVTLRREIGASARRYAVEHCDVDKYRRRLIGEFRQLIKVGRETSPSPTLLSALAPPLAAFSKERLADLMSEKVHYACGRRILEGWLNVDMFDDAYPHEPPDAELRDRILYADLRVPQPFPDNSFEFGYSEDFLEHLDQADSLIFLAEAYRTLKPGGVLRLSTPGLPGILRRHLRSNGHGGGAVWEAYTRWNHLHFYTFESLELVARHIGFSKVERCQYGHSRYAVLEQETRSDQADLNLVVELTK